MLNIKHPLGTLIINPKYIVRAFINPTTKGVLLSMVNGETITIDKVEGEELKTWEKALMNLNNDAKNESA
jgi:hypothetical protein